LRQIGRLKVNVAKTLGTAGFAVGDDSRGDDTADGFEDCGEPLFIDVPREIADKDGGRAAGGRGGVFGLDSFGGGGEGFGFPFLGFDGFLFFFLVRIFVFIVVFFGGFFFFFRGLFVGIFGLLGGCFDAV
jgi:hypothetical protein